MIVGGGIAGPALAPHELRVGLIERDPGPLDTARGDHLQLKAVEILDNWGALDTIVDLGAEQRQGTIWYDHGGEPLVRAMLHETGLPHPYFLYLNHELINQALLTAAARNPNFVIYRPVTGWELTHSSDTQISVEISTGNGIETAATAVLVGADGQNSRVRNVVGIEAEIDRYQRPISILFAPYTEAPEANSLTAYIGEEGIVALVPRTGGICKVGIATDPDDLTNWRKLDGPALRQRLEAIAGSLPIGEPEHIGTYPPVRVTANHWVKDNVVLLGDACHAMHPAQSQGMNVSIRCADALTAALLTTPTTPPQHSPPTNRQHAQRSTRSSTPTTKLGPCSTPPHASPLKGSPPCSANSAPALKPPSATPSPPPGTPPPS
ncbi:MAG: NAD(P)/FAD-dependent oxidoreductase [Actinomycetota bacterium]